MAVKRSKSSLRSTEPSGCERLVDGYRIRTDPETSRRMADIRQHGTRPELVVRQLLRRQGHHYRLKNRDLPGSPDLANRSRRWAVFVHGCYWHRHPGCRAASTPGRNREFWLAKFRRNVERDAESSAALGELGYRVIVVWECETKRQLSLLEARLAEALPPPEPICG